MFQPAAMIAHRGLWTTRGERNTPQALQAALQSGFGIETDVRDYRGRLVISHDVPSGQEQTVEEFFSTYKQLGATGTLALNIKSDGLAEMLSKLIRQYDIQNYFCFDMSVPDSLHYQRQSLRYFARRSELEPPCQLTENAAGIWIDAFYGEWYTSQDVSHYLRRGQDVCIVSPELHGRSIDTVDALIVEMLDDLASLKASSLPNMGRLMICTDVPTHFMVQRCA